MISLPFKSELKHKVILVFFVLFYSYSSNGQIIDSIKLALHKEPRIYFGFQNRNTFVNTDNIKLWGIVGGLDFEKKVKLYAGIYGFRDANATLLKNQPQFEQDTVYRSLNTSNLGLGIEYTYFVKNRLSLSLPLQIGIGGLNYHYTGAGLNQREGYTIAPIEFGTNAFYSIIKYVGLKGELGYRLILAHPTAAKYSSPYYSFGVSVAVGQLYRDVIAK